MQSKPEIPEGTTHIWLPMFEKHIKVYWYMAVLGFYRFDDTKLVWYVYSDVTGWRESTNPPKWFYVEVSQGDLVTVEEWYAKSGI